VVATSDTVSSAGGDTRLRRSQAARRERVLETVLELLEEGGDDAVRMKTVWERTGVGTDTLYRYFGSREGMIADAMHTWSRREFFEPSAAWAEGDTAAEQVLSVCRRTWEVWERAPRMLEPFVRVAVAPGARDAGLAAESRRVLVPLLVRALDGVDPAFRDDVLLAVGQVTHSAMTWVTRGQLLVTDAYPMIERTLRRLFEHPAMEGHRPSKFAYRPGRSA
jgi:AcrR family transcriptional regulator